VREGLNYWRYLSPAFDDAPKLRARWPHAGARAGRQADRFAGSALARPAFAR
jgi:hypothetical protein